MERRGIAVAGSILVDKINEISAYPALGELTKILSLKKALGGCVPNVSIDLKRLCPELDVYAIGKIGKDEEAKFVNEVFSAEGIDTAGIKEVETDRTSFTEVMSVIGGQRTFFTYPGASAGFGFEDFDWDNMSVRMLHLGYFLLLDKIDAGDGLRVLKEAKARGISTSIDLVTENSDRYKLVLPCLPYTDNLIINEAEAGKLVDISPTKDNLAEIAEALHNLGVRERVIIHLPDMSLCHSNEGCISLPSYELPRGYIKGTTGAGDAFCAGALLGIYEGLSDMEILKLASLCATASLGEADATAGLGEKNMLLAKFNDLKRKK